MNPLISKLKNVEQDVDVALVEELNLNEEATLLQILAESFMITKFGLIAFVCLFIIQVQADTSFPLPQHRLECTQVDPQTDLPLRFNREIRIQFEEGTFASATIALGAYTQLPKTVCWQDRSAEFTARGPSIFEMKSAIECFKDMPGGYGTEKSKITMRFDAEKMNLVAGGFEYKCEWRRNPLADD